MCRSHQRKAKTPGGVIIAGTGGMVSSSSSPNVVSEGGACAYYTKVGRFVRFLQAKTRNSGYESQ